MHYSPTLAQLGSPLRRGPHLASLLREGDRLRWKEFYYKRTAALEIKSRCAFGYLSLHQFAEAGFEGNSLADGGIVFCGIVDNVANKGRGGADGCGKGIAV